MKDNKEVIKKIEKLIDEGVPEEKITNDIEDYINTAGIFKGSNNTTYNEVSMEVEPQFNEVEIKMLEKLKKKQEETLIKENGKATAKTLVEILDKKTELEIEKNEIPVDDLLHDDLKESKYLGFAHSYAKNVYPQDVYRIFASLSKLEEPLFITSFNVNDNSDELNYIEDYKVRYRTRKGKGFYN